MEMLFFDAESRTLPHQLQKDAIGQYFLYKCRPVDVGMFIGIKSLERDLLPSGLGKKRGESARQYKRRLYQMWSKELSPAQNAKYIKHRLQYDTNTIIQWHLITIWTFSTRNFGNLLTLVTNMRLQTMNKGIKITLLRGWSLRRVQCDQWKTAMKLVLENTLTGT